MTDMAIADPILILLSSALGINIAFWSCVGALRYISALFISPRPKPDRAPDVADVAVVIAAHNEELALPGCLASLTAMFAPEQIYVASDGSADRTVEIARTAGCRHIDIQPNGGKARALDHAIRHFNLCDRYEAVLIQDADSEIDLHYLEHALPLLADPGVGVVAGHVQSRWRPHFWPRADMIYSAYRTRLYRILQSAFQYGQSWRWTNVSYIAPGFASLYRSGVLSQIDITANGLVIEDFNMTFEVHRKKLGRIAYTPLARCSTEDPLSFADYRKQVHRWYLGFWQTVRRHGIWASRFWISLASLLVELMFISALILALPLLAMAQLVAGMETPAFSFAEFSVRSVSPMELLAVFLGVDYLLTLIVAVVDRRLALLIYGIAFPFIRLLDALLFLRAFVNSFTVQSNGSWVSPRRRSVADGEGDRMENAFAMKG